MLSNGNAATAGATVAAATPVAACETQDDEPLLYVNARQYKRILKRRQARAKLIDQGKIPKERPVSEPRNLVIILCTKCF